jgi:hypothetical protein
LSTTVRPETSFAAWERGSAASVRRIVGEEMAGSPGAGPPYDALSRAELDELIAVLEPVTARLEAAGSR